MLPDWPISAKERCATRLLYVQRVKIQPYGQNQACDAKDKTGTQGSRGASGWRPGCCCTSGFLAAGDLTQEALWETVFVQPEFVR
jgi:hypothetical protein